MKLIVPKFKCWIDKIDYAVKMLYKAFYEKRKNKQNCD